jgi:sulfate/thiosulfate transport system ATP-binding protein
VELTSAASGSPFTAQITRGDSEALALREGDTVYVRATRVPPIFDGSTGPSNDRAADAGEDQTTLTSA